MIRAILHQYLFACLAGSLGGMLFTVLSGGIAIPSLGHRLYVGGGFGLYVSLLLSTWFLFFYPLLKRVSFLTAVIINSIAIGSLLMTGFSLGAWTFLEGPSAPAFQWRYVEYFWASDDAIVTLVFGYGMTSAIVFLMSVSSLIGPKTLLRFISGRYHRARREEQIFLFIDLKGSTSLAETLGDHRFHAFISRFFEDLTPPVNALKGEFHRYIGDEALITFPVKRDENGRLDNACLRALQDIQSAFAEKSTSYQRNFGAVPEWRAGLHTGAVLTGEVGVTKQEIIFLGDVINTAARIASACRGMKEDILVSGDVLRQMDLPANMQKRDLGRHEVRGRDEKVHFYALDIN